jgi:signal peptidase I
MTGASMEPSVRAHEYFLTTSPPGELRRGMLVIFRYEDEDGVFHVLRRLAALPGDTVAMRDGSAVVNGRVRTWPFRIVEPRARRSPLAKVPDLYTWGPVVVPRDSVFLLADTRDIIGWPDSRFLGPVAVSAREAEVFVLLAQGLTNRQIGLKLGISPNTARTHVNNIFKVLEVSGRIEAINRVRGEAHAQADGSDGRA